jgi:hypothetical protein
MINLWLLAAVAAVIITRRFSKVAGGAVGVCVALGIGVWGMMRLTGGGGIAFAGVPITMPMFLGIIGVWTAFEAWGLWGAVRNARRRDGDDSPT